MMQGIASQPAPNMEGGFAQGGIVAFAGLDGSLVEEPAAPPTPVEGAPTQFNYQENPAQAYLEENSIQQYPTAPLEDWRRQGGIAGGGRGPGGMRITPERAANATASMEAGIVRLQEQLARYRANNAPQALISSVESQIQKARDNISQLGALAQPQGQEMDYVPWRLDDGVGGDIATLPEAGNSPVNTPFTPTPAGPNVALPAGMNPPGMGGAGTTNPTMTDQESWSQFTGQNVPEPTSGAPTREGPDMSGLAEALRGAPYEATDYGDLAGLSAQDRAYYDSYKTDLARLDAKEQDPRQARLERLSGFLLGGGGTLGGIGSVLKAAGQGGQEVRNTQDTRERERLEQRMNVNRELGSIERANRVAVAEMGQKDRQVYETARATNLQTLQRFLGDQANDVRARDLADINARLETEKQSLSRELGNAANATDRAQIASRRAEVLGALLADYDLKAEAALVLVPAEQQASAREAFAQSGNELRASIRAALGDAGATIPQSLSSGDVDTSGWSVQEIE